MKSEKIGNAKLIKIGDTPNDGYSDGDIENKLLDLFKSKNPNIENFRKENPSWATDYHLKLERQNLLNWYDFNKDSSLLEIGAGCGALTGLFAENCKKVTALELTSRRAEINVHRNKKYNNLEVVIGNIENLNSISSEKYDYVVCVGVLEYAGRFISGPNPFDDFIYILKKQLKPGGILLLAIENELGLKYFSGSREDHTQRYMESIEGYPHYDGIRTFGKKELQEKIFNSGLKFSKYYYPCPDYKMPETIYSDNYLPGVHTTNIPSNLYPTPNPDQPRHQIFREQLAIRSISKNGLFGDMANSFIIEASDTEIKNNNQPIFAHSSLSRKKEYSTITKLYNTDQGYAINKKSATNSGIGHLSNIYSNSIKLNKEVKNKSISINKITKNINDSMDLEYIHGPSLETELIELLINFKNTEALLKIDNFMDNILKSFNISNIVPGKQNKFNKIFGNTCIKETPCIKPGLVDMNFDNIISSQETGKYTLIDYEWCFDFGIPVSFIATRSLVHFFKRHSQIMRGLCSPKNPMIDMGNNLLIPDIIFEKYKNLFIDIDSYLEMESSFQYYVKGVKTTKENHNNTTKHITELPNSLVETYEEVVNVQMREVIEKVSEQQKNITIIQSELDIIKKSKSWKIISKIKDIRKKLSFRN